MAGLEVLTSLIYHERQQPGSMLCAQHALNSLLQGNYFTAPDLSDIAGDLDALETSYDDNAGAQSANMDDTGFFSVQVLEHALNVWGLSLVRWRSEAMRPYQEFPHTQMAFVLNQNQHWYTLRRFGDMSANPEIDTGNGHWFNLNSSLPSPEWIGKLYLGMFLQQAEADGYSVFVVVHLDPSAPLALPRTEADDVACTLPEPSSSRPSASSSTAAGASTVEGFEDEDMELQAALQASLVHGSTHGLTLPTAPVVPPVVPGSFSTEDEDLQSGQRTPRVPGYYPYEEDQETEEDLVAASMARSRAIMQRMQREQEMALREQYLDEAARVAHRTAPARVRTRSEVDEEEQLRRAIMDSRVAGEAGLPQTEMEEDQMIDDEDYDDSNRPMRTHPSQQQAQRVYDDEDAELQAALRASLETMPPGSVIPASPPPVRGPVSVPATTTRGQQSTGEAKHPDGEEEDTDTDESNTSDHPPPENVSIDVDEMRRRRLARFGS